jgi:prepilin-type processing-associated H-X9-DG protein
MEDTRQRLIECSFVAVLVICLMAMLIPVRPSMRGVRPLHGRCKNNLRQIGLALWNYHDEHGTFPPAYIADKDGKPMHSWRVLILRQMDRVDVYSQYRFDEPWNSPQNRRLESLINSYSGHYRCPQDGASDDGRASYLAVIGPQTAWPGSEGAVRDRDFPKGTDKTVMLVEVADSGIRWMEPRDLNFDEMNFTPNDPRGNSPSAHHSEKGRWLWNEPVKTVHVLFADGHVEPLPIDTAAEKVRELLTARSATP